mgnify:CR=1 FL=1
MSDHAFRISSNEEISRGKEIEITLNGFTVSAFEGETVATMLLALDKTTMRTTIQGEPRGIYCGMGICFDCLVVIDGIANKRACIVEIKSGMKVQTQVGSDA